MHNSTDSVTYFCA